MTGPSSLIRKSAFEVVGGYDKDIYLTVICTGFTVSRPISPLLSSTTSEFESGYIR